MAFHWSDRLIASVQVELKNGWKHLRKATIFLVSIYTEAMRITVVS
jgi:hypothetical protein